MDSLNLEGEYLITNKFITKYLQDRENNFGFYTRHGRASGLERLYIETHRDDIADKAITYLKSKGINYNKVTVTTHKLARLIGCELKTLGVIKGQSKILHTIKSNQKTIIDNNILPFDAIIYRYNISQNIIEFVDPKVESILGIEQTEFKKYLLGHEINNVDKVNRIITNKRVDLFLQCRQQNVHSIYEEEYKIKNGTWVRETIQPVYSKTGEVIYAIGYIVNINHYKVLNETINELYQHEAELKAKYKQKLDQELLYSRAIIHELSTPLTSILTATESLKEYTYNPTHDRLIELIQQSSNMLNDRINQIYQLIKSENGLVKLNITSLNVVELITAIKVDFEMRSINTAKISMNYSGITSSYEIRADSSKISQIINNILENSIKHTNHNKPNINIIIDKTDSHITIKVSDDGPGIPETSFSKIFNPYYIAAPNDCGLGLGLYLCKVFVELHGGNISIYNNKMIGCTVEISIPIDPK
jgi:signal transduction histidine kinase